MTAHPAIAALPSASDANKSALRALLVRDLVYFMDEDADPQAFDPTDSTEGTVVPVIAWKEKFYWYDADDSTTAHDGTSTLVTLNGERYKLEDGVRLFPYAVLDKDETAPTDTTSPSAILGDAYLVPAGASGEWGSYEDYIAIYTSRGWRYVAPFDGMFIHVDDEDAFYHYDNTNGWQKGFGAASLPSLSVLPSMHVGGSGSVVWMVENQTTTSPPTVAQGTAYIIGSGATGDWLGQDAKLALRESAGTNAEFTIYDPPDGTRAFDIALGYDVQWDDTNGTWDPAGGDFTEDVQVFTSSDTWTKPDGAFLVHVEAQGPGGDGAGGASGTSGGGGGQGGLAIKSFAADSLAANISITISSSKAEFTHTTPVVGNTGSDGSSKGGAGAAQGGAGGTATGGDVNLSGQAGGPCASDGSNFSIGGTGGGRGGGKGGAASSGASDGQNGQAAGGGGGGSASLSGTTTEGSGAAGQVVVRSFVRA